MWCRSGLAGATPLGQQSAVREVHVMSPPVRPLNMMSTALTQVEEHPEVDPPPSTCTVRTSHLPQAFHEAQ
jgi:hypothetical protein